MTITDKLIITVTSILILLLLSGFGIGCNDSSTNPGQGDDPDPLPITEGFVEIPVGTFMMGSPATELGHEIYEALHQVTLTTPFEMCSTEVTNQQFAELAQWAYDQGHCGIARGSLIDALDGSTVELLKLDDTQCEISFTDGLFSVDPDRENHPVIMVTWYGAATFCDWLSLRAELPRAYDHSTPEWECNGHAPYEASGYRLPTEAEWEYACRAGSDTAFYNGEITDLECDDPVLDQVAWYCDYYNRTHPVASFPANAFGLYDMHGNAFEWCNDWYAGYEGDASDPVGPNDPRSDRLFRGGSWSSYAHECRSAIRRTSMPTIGGPGWSFRVVRSNGS